MKEVIREDIRSPFTVHRYALTVIRSPLSVLCFLRSSVGGPPSLFGCAQMISDFSTAYRLLQGERT
jgi:hypothetical protein